MDERTIAIAATFTAEPLQGPLTYWLTELDMPHRIRFAPHDQVFQTLLTPGSLFSENKAGINVVLLKLDDWKECRQSGAAHVPEAWAKAYVDDFVAAVAASVSCSGAAHLVMTCPLSPSTLSAAESSGVSKIGLF